MAWLIYKAVTTAMASGNKDYTKAESIYEFTAKGTLIVTVLNFYFKNVILKLKIIIVPNHKNHLLI